MTRGSSTRPSTTVLLLVVLTVQSYLVRERWHSKPERPTPGGDPAPQGAPAPAATGVRCGRRSCGACPRGWCVGECRWDRAAGGCVAAATAASTATATTHARTSFNTSNTPGDRRSKFEEYSARRLKLEERTANAPPPQAADVDCGRHRSPSCGECPQGRGSYDCGGECHWDPDAERRDLRCLDGAAEAYTSFKVVSEGQVTYLHELLSAVARAFEAHGVKYWLIDGTLIGAMRNRPPGILRWDDDLDIGVTHDDFPRALAAISSARNPRIDCKNWDDKYWDGRKCGLESHNSKGVQGKKFTLDIVEWHYVKNCHGTRLVDEHCGKGPHWNIYSSPRDKANWFTKRYFLASEVESTVPCQFWDLTLQCPRNSVAYLRRAFGAEVMSNATITTHSVKRGPKDIALDADDVNDHAAFLPGLDRDLMRKLMSNPNLDGSEEGA